MHFLLTNDDGIDAIGLKALSAAIVEAGHTVTVCAPQTQQSAASHHLTLNAPLMVREAPWEGGEAYALAGTPADCARIGRLVSKQPIDFCFSGINNGENAGSAVYYSGTVAAAREAAMCYIPSMAVSIMRDADEKMRDHLADLAVRMAEHFHKINLPRFALINLNAPAVPVDSLKPMKVCPLSQAYYLDGYERRVSPLGQTYFWLKANDDTGVPMEQPEPGSDYDYLRKGHITCTILGNFRDYNDDYRGKIQEFLD